MVDVVVAARLVVVVAVPREVVVVARPALPGTVVVLEVLEPVVEGDEMVVVVAGAVKVCVSPASVA